VISSICCLAPARDVMSSSRTCSCLWSGFSEGQVDDEQVSEHKAKRGRDLCVSARLGNWLMILAMASYSSLWFLRLFSCSSSSFSRTSSSLARAI
jgi:hypothetical protein